MEDHSLSNLLLTVSKGTLTFNLVLYLVKSELKVIKEKYYICPLMNNYQALHVQSKKWIAFYFMSPLTNSELD